VCGSMMLFLLHFAGLDQEGIFRVSGSARVVERLKTLSEINSGDVELGDEADIMAVAGLLKLYLRELPDSVIPADAVRQFLQLQASELSFDNDNFDNFIEYL